MMHIENILKDIDNNITIKIKYIHVIRKISPQQPEIIYYRN